MAEYRTAKGTPYWPDEEKTADCPVAIITSYSQELLQIFSRAEHAHDASGAALFGPALADWPTWAVDAINVIEICAIREGNARQVAEQAEIPQH